MDFLRPKSKERVKREKTGLFDIGNGLAGKRNKKTPLILIPSTTSTKWNLPGKPMDWRRKKTKKLTYKIEHFKHWVARRIFRITIQLRLISSLLDLLSLNRETTRNL